MGFEAMIRSMTEADLDQVLAIECLCHSTPWSRAMFQNELDNPLSRIDLLWLDGRLAGFLCSWRVCRELSILNIATAPAMRRRGVARTLLERALDRNMQAGLDRALLEVRASNQAAITLYLSFGFRQIDCRQNYYRDGEDALVMEWLPTDLNRPGTPCQKH